VAPKFFGKRSGFENLRDLIVFGVGLGGIAPQIYEIARGGQANLGALMFFGAFLAAPSVINNSKSGDKR
jgi:hypothetical protein